MHDLLGAVWFFLPAIVANMVPVLSNAVPGIKDWDAPMDFGKKWHGQRILGNNKRWRGLLTGVFAAALTGVLQLWLYQESGFVRDFAFLDYNTINVVALGILLGFGALIGDAAESFFKRQRGIKSGEAWMPFDQIDWIIGGLLFSLLMVSLSLWQYLLVFLLAFLIHPVGSFIGHSLKLKD